jgi:hypothetical protein
MKKIKNREPIYEICEQFFKNHEHFLKIINQVSKFMTFLKYHEHLLENLNKFEQI